MSIETNIISFEHKMTIHDTYGDIQFGIRIQTSPKPFFPNGPCCDNNNNKIITLFRYIWTFQTGFYIADVEIARQENVTT